VTQTFLCEETSGETLQCQESGGKERHDATAPCYLCRQASIQRPPRCCCALVNTVCSWMLQLHCRCQGDTAGRPSHR
jgi:hypothetical protein